MDAYGYEWGSWQRREADDFMSNVVYFVNFKLFFLLSLENKAISIMGKKDKSKKGKGAEKTIAKTLKKQTNKLKKELAAKGEVNWKCLKINFAYIVYLSIVGRPWASCQRTWRSWPKEKRYCWRFVERWAKSTSKFFIECSHW